jgi:multicomponent Na+:H+ antiporter subunit F
VIPNDSPLLTFVLNLVLGVLSLSLFLAFIRLVKGPSLPDRVVALELIATLTVGFIAVYDIATLQPVLLDAAIIVALVSFLGAVAFARYVEKGAEP